MHLMFETEYWLEEIRNVIDQEEGRYGIALSNDRYADIAKALRSRVIDHMFFNHAVKHISWSHQQRVGTLVLIQSATDEERQAFDAALRAEHGWVCDQVQKEIDAEREFISTGGE